GDGSSRAVAAAGAVAAGVGSQTAISLAGVGAGSINTVNNTTEARITGGSVTSLGSVELHATDESSIEANAGALSISLGGGVGASFAVNTITDTTRALLHTTARNAGGDVGVSATSDADVLAITVGFTGGLAVGGNTINLGVAGAGSFSANTITDSTTAAVQNGHVSAGSIHVSATDDTAIRAAAGA